MINFKPRLIKTLFNNQFMTRKYIASIFVLVLFFQGTAVKVKPSWKAGTDSIHKVTVLHRKEKADSIRNNVVQVVFSREYADTLLLQIEHLHSTLNSITNETKYGFKTQEIEVDLHTMESNIDIITESLSRDSSVLNINNLQMFRGLLKDMEDKLHGWKDVLYKDKKDLESMSAEMNVFVQDSFTQMVAADTAFAKLHLDEMLVLHDRWGEAQTATNTNLARISKLQAAVSSSYFDVIELQNKVANQLAGTGLRIFGKEYNFIWNTHSPFSLYEVTAFTEQSFEERLRVLKYYLQLNVWDWLSIILSGVVFFFWIVWNFRKIKSITNAADRNDLNFKYIKQAPLLGAFIFILNLAPFYGFNQPALYIEVLQFFILIPLSIIFWRIWRGPLFICWCVQVLLFLSTSAMNAIITPGWPLRFFVLGLNLSAIVFGFRFIAYYNRTLSLGGAVKFVAVLFIIMNFLSVAANIMGRLTLAKILTSTAVIGLTQIIGLFVLVPMLIEVFYLQMKSSRISGGMAAKFSYDDIQKGLFQLFSVMVIILWLVTFATNLEIYNAVMSFLDKVLNTQRAIGSTSFSIGNILTFIVILFVVNILQKYVGYFFGETEDDTIGDLDKKESRLIIFRLAIIMAGFFIAVVASGLPVDKVTVVLGALGVGIGLGLQNIVYNLVSGVILVFEKPMQIGDYIEVADKRGRVQSIGIRSSKLITPDGSEVIVPNGDILSSHMVNWTRGNNNRRAQLNIKIEQTSDLQNAKEIIIEELKKDRHVIQERPVEILLNDVSEKAVGISINVWINSIYKEQEFRSEVLANIYNRLAAKGIKII